MANTPSLKALLDEFLPDAQVLELREPGKAGHAVLYTLLALVLTAIIWASVSEIDVLTIGRGRLVTSVPNLVVQPLEPGILRSIDVRVGQVVKKGTVLATLDATFATADAEQLGSRQSTLSLQARRLESELNGKGRMESGGVSGSQQDLQRKLQAERQAAYAARIRQFDETILHLRATLETNRQDQKTLAQRLASFNELESLYSTLEAKQFSSRAKVLEVREKRLEVERDHTLAVNRQPEILREIATVEAERMTYSKTWRQETMEKLSVALQQGDEVDKQLNKARLRSDLVRLVAPQDAIVLEIGKRSVGSVVKDAEPLFTLVSLEGALEAEVEVEPADVAELRVGGKARIKVDAYPFQKHGSLEGEIISISPDSLSRQNSAGGGYYYAVRAVLKDTHLDNLPNPPLLLPGMSVSGEMITGKRSIASYFLYPIIRAFSESLRER